MIITSRILHDSDITTVFIKTVNDATSQIHFPFVFSLFSWLMYYTQNKILAFTNISCVFVGSLGFLVVLNVSTTRGSRLKPA